MTKGKISWQLFLGVVLLLIGMASAHGVVQARENPVPPLAMQSIAGGASSAGPENALFDAALCDPPIRPRLQRTLWALARDLPVAPVSLPGVRIVSLAEPLMRGDFVAHEALFSATGVGVLISGHQAAALAARFGLHRERAYSAYAVTRAFVRALAPFRQPAPLQGTVMIVARESRAFPDRTWLSCEFVPVGHRVVVH